MMIPMADVGVVEMATKQGCSAGAQNGDGASLPTVATVGNLELRRGVRKAVETFAMIRAVGGSYASLEVGLSES